MIDKKYLSFNIYINNRKILVGVMNKSFVILEELLKIKKRLVFEDVASYTH